MVNSNRVFLLNSAVLTSYGLYKFSPLTLEKAKEIIKSKEVISAIGHSATAEFLSYLLGIQVPVNRISITMNKGDSAIIFRLLERLPEGKILTIDEMKNIKWELALLECIES